MQKVRIYNDCSKLAIWLRSFCGHIVILEGLISAGKTTLGNSIEHLFNKHGITKVKFFKEYKNQLLLDNYIDNMEEDAYSFQMIMLRERFHIYQEARNLALQGYVIFIDRSLAGDLAFGLMQKDKFFSERQWNVYLHTLEEGYKIEPSLIVYLYVPPAVAFKRMQERGEESEVNGYNLEYFEDLHESYQNASKMINSNMINHDWLEDKELYTLTASDSRLLIDKVVIEFLYFVYHQIHQHSLEELIN